MAEILQYRRIMLKQLALCLLTSLMFVQIAMKLNVFQPILTSLMLMFFLLLDARESTNERIVFLMIYFFNIQDHIYTASVCEFTRQ
jgi:hypothetical protein